MSPVLVVTVEVFIVSENVTEIDDEIETEVSESEGEVEEMEEGERAEGGVGNREDFEEKHSVF